MKDIAIYGAGGLGREVAALIHEQLFTDKDFNLVGFFDDGVVKGSVISDFGNILGGINELNNWPTPLYVALCFGAPRTIEIVRNKITNPNISFPNLIISDVYFSHQASCSLGEGNIILGGCIFTVNISIGNFNLCNGPVTFGHDARIGNYNVFMAGTRISGEVKIGNRNLFGTMSFVHQGLKIGDDVTLAPLAPLLTKPKNGGTYIGNPAKILKY